MDKSYENRLDLYSKKIFGDMQTAFSEKGHPAFHLTAPSHFTIDFWGAFFDGEYYHIMFHVCPERGDFQDETVFFHARSENLVDWELLPPPIIPLDNEIRLNDGFISRNGKGEIVMIYTSVPKDSSIPRTHCAAIGTNDLMRFERIPENPIMTLENHGGPKFGFGWSDPFIFKADGRTFMLMSKCVHDGKDRMPIYEATDDSLLHWEYRGIFLEDNGEVVNFLKIGEKWVLICSPYRAPEYYIGNFDSHACKFIPESHGILSYGYFSQGHGTPMDRGFYATCVYSEGKWQDERHILCGWISGFGDNEYWNGCMGVPRQLALNDKMQLIQAPIKEIDDLRACKISDMNDISANTIDIELVYSGKDCLLQISDNIGIAFSLNVTDKSFTMNGRKYECDIFQEEKKSVRVLIDKSVAEIFLADGAVCGTRCFRPLENKTKITVSAKKIHQLDCYEMKKANIF